MRKQGPKAPECKKIHAYWWDLEGENEVIVESDDPQRPVVGRFTYDPSLGAGCASGAIAQAEKHIADLKAGRVTPVAC